MSLILKQESSANVPTPSAGKGTIFLNASDQIVVKDSAGNLSVFATTTSATNTQVFFNDSGALGQDNTFLFNKTNDTLTVSNLSVTGTSTNVTGTLSVTGNANIGNIGTAGLITATGNITGANLVTSGVLSVTGNANIGNIGTAGLITATGNITGANLVTGGVLSVTGNANIGNIGTAGLITATGNVNAGNLNTAGLANSATLTVSGNANIGNIGTAGLITATGNITGANLVTGGVLSVTGNANIGNIGTAGLITATGNIQGGNLVTSGIVSATGNILAGNVYANTGTIGASLLTGTLTTTSQPNVTSLGTLSSLTVSGNSISGNVYSNSGTIGASLLTGTLTTAAQPNVTSVGTLSSLSVTGNVAAGNLTTLGVLTVSGTGVSSIGGNLDMTSNTIINLATPTNSTDAATKQYVDDVAQGLNIHDSCQAATSATLATATSGTITYNNGSSGVGATLTTTGSYTTIDGVNIATIGTRILVKNEANAVHNGIYTYTNSTTITRATDYDSIPEVEAGDFVFITGGTLYDNTGWVQTSTVSAIGTVGNNIDFTQFSGAGTYTAGTGLTLTGSQFSANASQTQITAVGTLTSLSVSGNANIGNIGTAGLITATGNIRGANLVTSGVLSVTSNANIGNIGTAGLISATGNVTGGNLLTGGLVSATGNLTAANGLFTASNVTVTITDSFATASAIKNLNIESGTRNLAMIANLAPGSYSNLTAANDSGIIFTGPQQGNANLVIAPWTSATSGIRISSVNNVATITLAAANTSVSGNIIPGNVLTAGLISATANITGGNILTAGLISATGNITGGNVIATTSLNTASVLVSTATGRLGLATDAGGSLSIGLIDGSSATTPYIDFNSSKTTVDYDARIQVSGNTGTVAGGTLTITAANTNVSALLNVTGTATVGNVSTGGTVSATGNITGANVITTSYSIASVGTGISAAGSTQGTATAISKAFNVVSTVSSGANGVSLPTAVAGMRITIINTSANALNVYPLGNGIINTQAANAALSVAAGGKLDFLCTATATAPGGQWYTLNATYA